MRNIFVILGPSGSGKGTQAQILSQKLKLPVLSMGQIFRDLIAKNDPVGLEAKKAIDQGLWVNDDLTMKALAGAVKGLKGGFIIDGFPRNPDQPKLLDNLMAELGGKVAVVIHFDVSDEISQARMMKRLEEEKAAGKLRSDQTPQVMKERLKSYHDTIEPVLAYYQGKGVLERVNGEPTVEEIAKDIEKRLKARGISFNV